MFNCYLSKKLVVWMYNFVVVVCFRFCQIIFVYKLLKFCLNYTELNVSLWWNKLLIACLSVLFNCYQLYFEVVINSVNLYMYKFVCMNVDSW
jgi:hypothetical protein